MTDLEQLALRVEQASGAERELDVAIWLALAGPADIQAYQEGLQISKAEAAFRAEYMMDGFNPTASIDAALTLVPRTGFVELNFFFGNNQHKLDENSGKENALVWPIYNEERCEEGNAATPALALCAASLRARSA